MRLVCLNPFSRQIRGSLNDYFCCPCSIFHFQGQESFSSTSDYFKRQELIYKEFTFVFLRNLIHFLKKLCQFDITLITAFLGLLKNEGSLKGPISKICCIYPTIMKTGTVIPSLPKEDPKKYSSQLTRPFIFSNISIF